MSEARSILDCGHQPSPHSESTTGTAHTSDGREICWECAYKQERIDLLSNTRHFAYITEQQDGRWAVSNWPGFHLGMVVHKHEVNNTWVKRGAMCSHWYYVRVVDVHGQHWFGYTGGPGLYVRLRKPRQCAECHVSLKGKTRWLHPDDIAGSEFCSCRCVERVVERSKADG